MTPTTSRTGFVFVYQWYGMKYDVFFSIDEVW